jgi:hypothetical protein
MQGAYAWGKKQKEEGRAAARGAARVLAGPSKAISRLYQGSIKAPFRDLRQREVLHMCLQCPLRLL